MKRGRCYAFTGGSRGKRRHHENGKRSGINRNTARLTTGHVKLNVGYARVDSKKCSKTTSNKSESFIVNQRKLFGIKQFQLFMFLEVHHGNAWRL